MKNHKKSCHHTKEYLYIFKIVCKSHNISCPIIFYHENYEQINAQSTTLCVKHSSNKLYAGSKDVSLHMHGLPTIEFNLMVAAMTSLQFPSPILVNSGSVVP